MTEIIKKKMTVQEFRVIEFPENDFSIYELINGVVMRKTAPKPAHQEASIEVEFAIKLYLKTHPIGRMYHAPIDVFSIITTNHSPIFCL